MRQNSTDLQQFIDSAKSKGASDEFLAALLSRRGWPIEEVYSALGDYWERETGITLPDRATSGESSRDAFLYLLSFATLATWATALGSLLFELINYWFPDPVTTVNLGRDLRHSVTWQMASLAVAFPIYLMVMRLIFSEVVQHPERLQSGVRKWLTWLALLITAGTMIGDLIYFLDYFLTGELTLRFVLKAGVVLLICGAIFTCYLDSLRWAKLTSAEMIRQRGLLFAAGATFTIVAAVAAGLDVAGTPSDQRQLEADAHRVRDLQNMERNIRAHPQDRQLLRDPETGQPYQFRAKAGTAYELCATFNRPSPNEPGREKLNFWTHGAGRTCFQLDSARLVP